MAVCSLGVQQASGGLNPLALFPHDNPTLLTTEFLIQETFEATPIFANECKDPQSAFASSSCEHASNLPVDSCHDTQETIWDTPKNLKKRQLKAASKAASKVVKKTKTAQQVEPISDPKRPESAQFACSMPAPTATQKCKRCTKILAKRMNTEGVHMCDVGIKSIFRSIRRCATSEFSSYSAEELQSTLASRLVRTEPETFRETLQLIWAFNHVKLTEDYNTNVSLSSEEVNMCALLQQVCYKWNFKAHEKLLDKPAFQTLLSLSSFSSANILRNMKPEERQCRNI